MIKILEKELTRYLTGKFEEERIKQVKKTTNWNMSYFDLHEGLKVKKGGNDRGRTVQDIQLKKLMESFELQKFLSNSGATQGINEDFRNSDAQEYMDGIANENNKTCWAVPLNA